MSGDTKLYQHRPTDSLPVYIPIFDDPRSSETRSRAISDNAVIVIRSYLLSADWRFADKTKAIILSDKYLSLVSRFSVTC